jgi:hypothetical protein
LIPPISSRETSVRPTIWLSVASKSVPTLTIAAPAAMTGRVTPAVIARPDFEIAAPVRSRVDWTLLSEDSASPARWRCPSGCRSHP